MPIIASAGAKAHSNLARMENSWLQTQGMRIEHHGRESVIHQDTGERSSLLSPAQLSRADFPAKLDVG
jgi:hypothetical protein